jgi:hypothetical protein
MMKKALGIVAIATSLLGTASFAFAQGGQGARTSGEQNRTGGSSGTYQGGQQGQTGGQ